MATGEIDKLQLDINVSLSNSAINKINSLSNAIDNLLSKDFSGLSKIAGYFTSLNTSLTSVKTNGLTRLSKKITELNTNVSGLDSATFIRKFGEMTTAVTPFIDKIKSAKTELQTLNALMTKSGSATAKSLGIGNKETGALRDKGGSFKKTYALFTKGINVSALIAKLYVVRNVVRAIARVISNAVQRGIEFTETLNLWQTSMRKNVGVARDFISKMNKAYGIAEATLMRYQATFKNMLSALGTISEQSAYDISESLTQMALDFSSLYNTTIDEAMNKFQAVLSGQVRPIRSISGYDITENTIYALYQSLGGTKTMRQLDQTEKRLLRILAVFQQMSDTGALGDLAKTLTTNANQLRMMKEQAAEISTWFGNAVSYLVQEKGLLVTINSYLFALKEAAKSLAYELGYKEDNFISGIFEDGEKANEEIEKLQNSLYGFDKFQTAKQAENDSISVESVIIEALQKYKSALGDVVNPAQEASQKILEQFGFKLQEIVDEETGATVQVWKWGDGTQSLIDKVKELANSLKGIGLLILAIKSPFAAILTLVEATYLKNAEFRKQINDVLVVVGNALGQIGTTISNSIVKLMPKLEPIITSIIGLVGELLPIVDDLMPLVEAILDLGIAVLPPILSIIRQLVPFIRQIVQKLVPPLVKLVQALVPIIIKIVGYIEKLMPYVEDKLTILIDTTITLIDCISIILGIIDKLTNEDWGFLDLIKARFDAINIVLQAIKGVAETIKVLLDALFNWDFSGLKEKLLNVWKSIGDGIEKLWQRIKESFEKFISDSKIGKFLKTTADVIKSLGSQAIDWFKRVFSGTNFSFSGYATGGFPQKGTMFYAGEAGAEIVANMGGGQSGVMNMEQLTNAITKGMIIANNVSGNDQPITLNVNVGNDNWFNITRNVARQNGYDLVKL